MRVDWLIIGKIIFTIKYYGGWGLDKNQDGDENKAKGYKHTHKNTNFRSRGQI